MSMLFLIGLALVACKGDSPAAGADSASPGGDGGTDTAPLEFDCSVLGGGGDAGPPPAVGTDGWVAHEIQPPGTRIFTAVQDHGTGSLFIGSDVAGTWRSQDDGETWAWMHAEITHNLSDLHVPVDHPGEVYRSRGGLLQRTVDDGESWHELDFVRLEPGEPAGLVIALGGSGLDGDMLYIFTSDGKAWRSPDDGETFEEAAETSLGPASDGSLHLQTHGYRLLGEVEEDGEVLLATPEGVYVSDPSLASWEGTLGGSMLGATLVRDPLDGDRVVVGSSAGRLYRSEDGGWTWEESAGWADAAGGAVAPGVVAWSEAGLFVAIDGALLHSEDGGATFGATPAHFDAPSGGIVTDSGRFAVADTAGLWLSDDQGVTWRAATAPPEDLGMAALEAHPVCPGVVVVGSRCSGGLFESLDWGDTWDAEASSMHYVMGAHWDPVDPGRLWVVSDDALWRRDAGAPWELVYLDHHFHGFAVDPRDGDHLLIGSVGSGEYGDETGRIYRSEDGGRSWTDSSEGLPETGASMHALLHWPGEPDVVLLGTYQGGDVSHLGGGDEVAGIGLFRSDDGGRSWAAVPASDASDAPREIAWLTPSPAGVVAATEDGLWESTDQGRSWQRIDGPDGWMLTADFHGDVGLAFASTGRSWRTDDGGATWVALEIPAPIAGSNPLASVSISADGSTAWVTAFNDGVWRISL